MLAALSAVIALAISAAPAHALQLGLQEPHSPNAEGISTAYWVMIIITTIALLAVNVALIAAVVKFRERRGREPRRLAAGRGALRPVIAGLSLVALAVFVFGVVVTENTREIEASGSEGLSANPTAQVGVKGLPPTSVAGDSTNSAPLQIDAIAQQWLWRFEYPDEEPVNRTFSYGELVVPVDTAVVLSIDSTDVIHSWWVPALGGQVQAVPGSLTETWFKADEVGRYEGRSTIFSGSAYPAMRSWVRVVTVPEYEAYLSDLRDGIQAAQIAVEEETSGATEEATP